MDSSALRIDHVTKSYGHGPPALADISLVIQDVEFVCVLGPSGSGKTTLLKILAGFTVPDQGKVFLRGQDITFQSPQKRNVGMVFQNYALFPNMSAFENVAFPLRVRGLPRLTVREKAAAALDLVGLSAHAAKRPSQLSGGQQQRVALARALVFEPRLLLMDEPLGALDRRLRQSLQVQVRHIQRQLKVPAVYVTHDQEEAMAMADVVVVLKDGLLEAIGSPRDLYQQPATSFVANFLGDANLITGTLGNNGSGRYVEIAHVHFPLDPSQASQVKAGEQVRLMVRPESIQLRSEGREGLLCVVEDSVFMGSRFRVWLRTEAGMLIAADTSGPCPSSGTSIRVSWKAQDAYAVPGG
jgi:ABC-type Fe3+/spermidine/putrescine transport system ATPase subunit